MVRKVQTKFPNNFVEKFFDFLPINLLTFLKRSKHDEALRFCMVGSCKKT